MSEADRISLAVDALLRDGRSSVEGLEPDEVALLATAKQLARLPALLGPVDAQLERRVMDQVRYRRSRPALRRGLRLSWVAAALVMVFVAVTVLTPVGRTSLASFMAEFNIGRTQVSITPAGAATAQYAAAESRGAARADSLTWDEAQELVAFRIRQPTLAPPGYQLAEVIGFTYPDLPAWVPQPFSVELLYRDDGGAEFALRMYPINLAGGDQATISGMNLEATPIQSVREVEVNDHPGVLLSLGAAGAKATWLEAVWELDDLVMVLSSSDLGEGELLDTAGSVR